MITNVVDFGDSLAKDVMVPKMDVEFVELSLTYDELIESYSKENLHVCLFMTTAGIM